MFLKPDYNLKNIYEINLEELKISGIKNMLFDLDSTIMASKSGCYNDKTIEWLNQVRKDFSIAVISNNHNANYIEKVKAVSDFPLVFHAKKPDIKAAKSFMDSNGMKAKETAFVGDRPLTDVLCGKKLGCTTILVDSISADIEKPIVRFARKLERCCIR